MRQTKTLRQRIENRIARKRRDDVFLTREFRDLGGEDQVFRALRSLVREKQLVRLGYGVYGRAIVSRLTGDAILYSANGFTRPQHRIPAQSLERLEHDAQAVLNEIANTR